MYGVIVMGRKRSNMTNRVRHRDLLSYINSKHSEGELSKPNADLDEPNKTQKEYDNIIIDNVKIFLKSSPEVEYEVNLVLNIEDCDEIEKGYLMSVEYDGERAKALAIFYNDKERKLYFWYDKTGHKPYFLTDIPPDNIMKLRDIVGHKSFEGVEVVKKIDLLRGVQRYLTKVIVKDPLAVRYLRNKVPTAWEADIKYHVNYVYDLQLVPGMLYRVQGARMELIEVVSTSDLSNIIDTVLGKETNRDLVKIATELAKLFETKPPKMPRIAIDIEVYSPLRSRVPSPTTVEFPIISIALVSNEGLKKVLVLYREGIDIGDLNEVPNDVEIEFFDSERGLIIECFKTLNTYPLILTFNGDNFDLPYLYNRALKLGISQDLIPIKFRQRYVTVKHGFHIDLYKFFTIKAVQAYAFDGKYKEYTLDAIASALLGIGKVALDRGVGEINVAKLVLYNLRDAQITLELTTFSNELVWKLIVLLMRISKLGIEDVTRSQVSAWIKNLFYWEHRRRGFLIPRRDEIKGLKGKKVTEAIIKGKKYAGAIVIEPPTGVFFDVTVLDFASLYPSIIKRWNLSYETVDPPKNYCKHKVKVVDEAGREIHEVCTDRAGVTSQIIGLLRDFRVKIYKKKAKDKKLNIDERSWYDVVQKAMKVYINASYGVFGSEAFPLYAPSVAESVTALGRKVITSTIDMAKKLGLQVLYGDTDSLFIWNPDKDKLEELKKWVEEKFGLELEVDKIYKFVAFALKKNYVGVYPDKTMDIKGMMGKKRNTPEFIKQAFVEAVKMLSEIETPEDVTKFADKLKEMLHTVYKRLRERDYNLDELAFKVMLSKPINEYKRTTPPHVKAANQLAQLGYQVVPGDIVLYVKVRGKEGVKPVQLAKISDIDIDKYLEYVRSTFEQLLLPLSLSWESISGSIRLEDFFTRFKKY